MTFPLNVELLDEAVAWVEEQAAKENNCQWHQQVWREPTACGTAYCVAGWVALRMGGQWVTDDPGHYGYDLLVADDEDDSFETYDVSIQDELIRSVGVRNRAMRLLGISDKFAIELFAAGNSAEDIRRIAKRIKRHAVE